MQSAHALRKLLVASFAIGALLLPGVQGHASGFDRGDTKAEYLDGVQAYRSGDYVKAISHFRHLLTQNGQDINSHYYLGLSLDNLNMGSQAIPEYQFVAMNGQEDKIVSYARARLQSLKSTVGSTVAARSEKNPDIAMVAAGAQLPASAYKGVVSQVSVPLKSNRNALMVDAVLTNDEARAMGTFIIDTGATYTSISQEMAEQMGLDLVNCEKVQITTANGRIEVPKVHIEKLSVNGLEAHDVEATVIQVRRGSSFSGLLGLSFIRQFVVTIDPQAGRLVFQKN